MKEKREENSKADLEGSLFSSYLLSSLYHRLQGSYMTFFFFHSFFSNSHSFSPSVSKTKIEQATSVLGFSFLTSHKSLPQKWEQTQIQL